MSKATMMRAGWQRNHRRDTGRKIQKSAEIINHHCLGPTGDECASQLYRLKVCGREIASGGPARRARESLEGAARDGPGGDTVREPIVEAVAENVAASIGLELVALCPACWQVQPYDDGVAAAQVAWDWAGA